VNDPSVVETQVVNTIKILKISLNKIKGEIYNKLNSYLNELTIRVQREIEFSKAINPDIGITGYEIRIPNYGTTETK